MGRYYLSNGKEIPLLREARKVNAVPSVTTVLNGVSPHQFKFLDSQRLKEAFEECDGNWGLAAEMLGQNLVFEQGSLVHEAAELYLKTGIESNPLDLLESTRSMFLHLDKIKNPVIEGFYYSRKMGTGGRIDVWGKQKNEVVLTDYKTGTSFKKKPSQSWLAQLGAYALLLEENGHHIDRAEILQYSKKNLGCRVIKLSNEELKRGKEIFIKSRELSRLWIGI